MSPTLPLTPSQLTAFLIEFFEFHSGYDVAMSSVVAKEGDDHTPAPSIEAIVAAATQNANHPTDITVRGPNGARGGIEITVVLPPALQKLHKQLAFRTKKVARLLKTLDALPAATRDAVLADDREHCTFEDRWILIDLQSAQEDLARTERDLVRSQAADALKQAKRAASPPTADPTTTCQVCARPIKANSGKIAHHGYQRPHQHGYQTASCPGARALPYEAPSYPQVLHAYVDGLIDSLHDAEQHERRLTTAAPGLTIPVSYEHTTRSEKTQVTVKLTEANFDALAQEHDLCRRTHYRVRDWASLLDAHRRAAASEVRALRDEATRALGRLWAHGYHAPRA